MPSSKPRKTSKRTQSFRIGRVRIYLRGRVWYLSYHEHGKRRQPRVGADRDEAKRLAAEINAQLEVGAPSALGFEPISIPDVRERWLDQHEHIRRSSLRTIGRYRSATQHLVNFIANECPVRRVSDFRAVRQSSTWPLVRAIARTPVLRQLPTAVTVLRLGNEVMRSIAWLWPKMRRPCFRSTSSHAFCSGI